MSEENKSPAPTKEWLEQRAEKWKISINPLLGNDELCDIIQNTCQLLNGIKPDGVEEKWWSEWDESVLQSLISALKRLQKFYGKSESGLDILIEDKAEKWARWYANEGSYKDWLKLPTSPFGREGDFSKTLRVAKTAYIAGAQSSFQPSSPDHTVDEIELWREVVKVVEDGQFLSTKYKEVVDNLKSKYRITRK